MCVCVCACVCVRVCVCMRVCLLTLKNSQRKISKYILDVLVRKHHQNLQTQMVQQAGYPFPLCYQPAKTFFLHVIFVSNFEEFPTCFAALISNSLMIQLFHKFGSMITKSSVLFLCSQSQCRANFNLLSLKYKQINIIINENV